MTVEDYIRQESEKMGIPGNLAIAMVVQESGGDQNAVSPKGAIGLFQLMPETAKSLGVDPSDPEQNIQGGLRHFKRLLDQYGGDVRLALSAYNAGENRILNNQVPAIPETQAYVREVLRRWQQSGRPEPTGAPASRTRSIVATPPPAWAVESSTQPDAGKPPGFLTSMASTFDPRTREGLRNIGGTAGALLAAGATRGAVGLPQAAAVIAGAGAGGAAGETVAQAGDLFVGRPPRLWEIAGAGAEQAALEMAGGVVAWPIKALGRRMLQYPVMTRAAQKLTGIRKETGVTLERAHEKAKQGVEAVRARLSALPSGPSATQTGRLVEAIMSGPARDARNRAGALVEQVAQKGPDLDIAPIKARAQEMFDREIKDLAQRFSGVGKAVNPEVEALLGKMFKPQEAAARERFRKRLVEEFGVPATEVEATLETAQHPVMNVLRRILNAGDEPVPFETVWRLRRELDEAVNYDVRAKAKAKQITKGLANSIRDLLGTYEPYREVAEAYDRIVPLYEEGIAPAFWKDVELNPENVIDLIKPDEPTKLAALHALLVGQSARVGRAQEGEAAWNAVQATWTYENLIRPGPEKLLTQLQKFGKRPEFLSTLYNNPSGRMVLQNLRHIGEAFVQAEQAVGEVKTVIAKSKAPTALEMQLATFAKGTRPMAEEAADLVRFVALGPFQIWGGLSGIRLLKGPKLNQLVQWASYSPWRTKLLVEAATSSAGGQSFAVLLRAAQSSGMFPWLDSVFPATQPRAQGAGPAASLGAGRSVGPGPVGNPPPAP